MDNETIKAKNHLKNIIKTIGLKNIVYLDTTSIIYKSKYSKNDYERLYETVCVLTNQQIDIMKLHPISYQDYETIIHQTTDYILKNDLLHSKLLNINLIIKTQMLKVIK